MKVSTVVAALRSVPPYADVLPTARWDPPPPMWARAAAVVYRVGRGAAILAAVLLVAVVVLHALPASGGELPVPTVAMVAPPADTEASTWKRVLDWLRGKWPRYPTTTIIATPAAGY